MTHKSPIYVAFLTSICVSVLAYFVLFFLLRADIIDTKSSTVQMLQEQGHVLQKTLDNNLSVIQEAITANIDTAVQSVVSIVATKDTQLYLNNITSPEQQSNIGGGNGIVISQSGYIITNKHVVQDSSVSYNIITQDGVVYPVQHVWLDPSVDIAILQIDGEFSGSVHEAQIAAMNNIISLGQFVFAVGNPIIQNTVTLGVISAKNKTLYTQGDLLYAGLLQTDASIHPGSSGGPLLDVYGEVIGIVTALDQYTQGVGFAFPISQEFVSQTLDSIQTYQKIIRPFVGFVYADITPAFIKKMHISDITYGIYIQDIVSGSPAQESGLLGGDIVVSINDTPINMDMPFLYQLYTYGLQDTLHLRVLRDGDSLSIDLTLRPNT